MAEKVYTQRDFNCTKGERPVAAGVKIEAGDFLGTKTDGYVAPVAAGMAYLGVARETVDNTNGLDGDVKVEVECKIIIKASVAGVSDGTVNYSMDTVYAVDKDTLTLTATGNVEAGKVEAWVEGDICYVKLTRKAGV